MTAPPVIVTAKIDDILAHGNPQRLTSTYTSRIVCADGFHLSVIAGCGAYSAPRTSLPGYDDLDLSWEPADYPGPYTAVEVGFPGERPEPWDGRGGEGWGWYAEEPATPTETVYGWVPGDMVRDLILLHGGEKS